MENTYNNLNKKYKIVKRDTKKSIIIGGNLFNFLNFEKIQDINCKNICTIQNNKITKLKYKNNTVEINKNIITLYHNDAEYTKFSIDKFEIYYGYLKEIIKIINSLLEYNKINRIEKKYTILILGFGLGGVCLNLSKYSEFSKIDTIDIDYDLFKIFKKIINSNNINLSSKINYIHGDAVKYLNYCELNGIKYDFIIDDLFDSNNKINYNFSILYKCLKPKGVFFMNVHYNPKYYVELLKKDSYSDVRYVNNNEYLIIAKK